MEVVSVDKLDPELGGERLAQRRFSTCGDTLHTHAHARGVISGSRHDALVWLTMTTMSIGVKREVLVLVQVVEDPAHDARDKQCPRWANKVQSGHSFC